METVSSERLTALAGRELFSLEDEAYTWSDVLAWASARGSLEELRKKTRHGLALVRRAEALDEPLDQAEVSASATSFRYEHGLLSAEELDGWLERWDLKVGEWGEHLERTLLLERFADEPEPPGDDDAPDALVADAEYVDAVCSGFLEREATSLATAAALANLPAGDREDLIERIEAGAAAARAAAITEEGVQREIANRRLDWTRLELGALELADEGAAREAALCVRVDGRAIADVAADCGAPLERTSAYIGDTEGWLQPALLSAQPGELVGPVEHDGDFLLLSVEGRALPAASDPELRRRAEKALVDRAVKRALEGRVEWHEHL